MFVGEAPGQNEDEQGIPFVGQAGEVLNTALFRAGTSRDEVVVTNAVKCRPPGNRRPEDGEIEACAHYLQQEDLKVKPLAMMVMGNVALFSVLGIRGGITTLHGKWRNLGDLLVMPALHPAYVKRTQRYDDFYEAVALFMKVYRFRLQHSFAETLEYATTQRTSSYKVL